MDGNGDETLLFTKMSPGLDNWRLEAQCSSTLSKSMQPYRSTIDPLTVPEENFGRMTTLIVGGKRVEGLQKESEKGNMGAAEVDESSSNKIKVVNAFKFVLVEHIRDVLKPFWRQGNLSRDAYKIIMKKSVDKIIESIEASKFPKNKNDHHKYLSASKSKIFELIQIASILKSVCLACVSGFKTPLCLGNQNFSCCQISSVNLSLGSLLYHKMISMLKQGRVSSNMDLIEHQI